MKGGPPAVTELLNKHEGCPADGGQVLTAIVSNQLLFPEMLQGLGGMPRRMYDGGHTYAAVEATAHNVAIPGLTPFVLHLNTVTSIGAWCLGLAQIPFIINFFWSIRKGKKVTSDNPWDATTLEWQTPTPPPHGNFVKDIEVYRGPYEYSVPGHKGCDFVPQNEPDTKPLTHANPVHS